MEELETNVGLIKFNRNASLLCGGAFVLLGLGIGTGMIAQAEMSTLHLCGTLLGGCGIANFSRAASASKQLKKIKR